MESRQDHDAVQWRRYDNGAKESPSCVVPDTGWATKLSAVESLRRLPARRASKQTVKVSEEVCGFGWELLKKQV